MILGCQAFVCFRSRNASQRIELAQELADEVHYYSRTTATPDDGTSVTVNITQYPNAEWARFDVLNSTGRVDLTRLSQFGHTFYKNGPYFSWSSDRLILVDCQGTPRPVIDEFLQAYFAKYPSDL